MSPFAEPLATGFDGSPVTALEDLINEGIYSPRHMDRVPTLIDLVQDEGALAEHRFQACFVLTSWAERAGYLAVQDAATDPYGVPWYGVQVDRFFSADNTFGFLAFAVDTSDRIVAKKGTWLERAGAIRALVDIADRAYFDGKLTYALDPENYPELPTDLASAIRRGIAAIASGDHPRFDLGTQLVDLAVSLIRYDEDLAVQLATELVQLAPSPRLLSHAVRVVEVGRNAASQTFSEYLSLIGESDIRQRAAAALRARDMYR